MLGYSYFLDLQGWMWFEKLEIVEAAQDLLTKLGKVFGKELWHFSADLFAKEQFLDLSAELATTLRSLGMRCLV